MDSFNVLSDDLLIKILSFAPTKVAVSTSILSKRWEYLWRWLSKLEFGRKNSSPSEFRRLQCFLDRNLPLHRAPVIESLHLQLRSSLQFKPDSYKLWIVVAISHCLRELEVNYDCYPNENDILPRNLYACKSLVSLKLNGDILLDVPQMVFLPSLKTLHLDSIRYFSEESFGRLLSNCPILEDLVLDMRWYGVMGELTVVAQSLQRLSLRIPYVYDIGGIVVKIPSLKYFKLVDQNTKNHYCLIENMPNLIEAHVDVALLNINSFIGSLKSVKHLTICSKPLYYGGFVFNQLQHLQLCRCNDNSSDLLVRLLNDSPNLQVLDICKMNRLGHGAFVYWKQPSTTPECMLSCLQTFKWKGYIGAPGGRDVVIYIMKNASHLKTTTIRYTERDAPDFEMRKELELSSRASTTCQLVFEQVLHYKDLKLMFNSSVYRDWYDVRD